MTQTTSTMRAVLHPNEAAEFAGTTRRFITKRCEDGTIKATKIGKLWFIDRSAFMRQLGIEDGGEA